MDVLVYRDFKDLKDSQEHQVLQEEMALLVSKEALVPKVKMDFKDTEESMESQD